MHSAGPQAACRAAKTVHERAPKPERAGPVFHNSIAARFRVAPCSQALSSAYQPVSRHLGKGALQIDFFFVSLAFIDPEVDQKRGLQLPGNLLQKKLLL